MMLPNLRKLMIILAIAAASLYPHPGSSIVVDAQGLVYFVDTGEGVWRLDLQGKRSLIHTVAYHWMALDEKGYFAKSALGEFDRGSFERITAAGSVPTLIISSDFPIAIGVDGGLYYVPFNASGPRQLVRRMPDGKRSVFATLPTSRDPKPMLWVNGIAVSDGHLYITDDDAVRMIDRNGVVSAVREGIEAPDCVSPLSDAPKLPYLRGLAVAPDRTIYAAANGCRSVIAIPVSGPVRTILKTDAPWSPTGVALRGNDIYVLEYLHTPGEDRRAWIPRVRKIGADGIIQTVTTVSRGE
jgi:hypothetical protein